MANTETSRVKLSDQQGAKAVIATATTVDTELEVTLVTENEGRKRLLALAVIEAMKVMGINPAEMKVTITGELE